MTGVAKAVGGVLTALGVLVLVGGLLAVGFGLYETQEQQGRVIQDRERAQQAQAALSIGAAVAAAGLICFIAGLITLLSSRPQATDGAEHPATLGGTAPQPRKTTGPASRNAGTRAQMDPAPDRMRRNALVGASVALLLVGLAVAALFMAQGDGPLFGSGTEPTPQVLMDRTFDGTLYASSFGSVGLPSFTEGNRTGEFRPPAGSATCSLTLDWDDAPPAAEQLRVEVSRKGTRVLNATGSPGFVAELAGADVADVVHSYAVHPAGGAPVVSQSFRLRVVCLA